MSVWDFLNPLVQVLILLGLPVLLLFLFFCLQSFWEKFFSSNPEVLNEESSQSR